MSIVKNKSSFIAHLHKADEKARSKFSSLVWNCLELLHHEAMEHTPVWSGSAVNNYRWSVGAQDHTTHTAIDNGPPGDTNNMALGAEPRRPPNEAESLASLHSVHVGNPFQLFWLNNNDPDIMALEYGQLPTPERSRSKGFARLSMEYVSLRVNMGTL